MIRRFEYESETAVNRNDPDLCATLEVEIEVECRDNAGDTLKWEVAAVTNLTDGDAVIALDTLPLSERRSIEERAEELAIDAVPDALAEYEQGLADHYYEQWKDRDQ